MKSILGDHEINFQVSAHAVLGDPMFNMGEAEPEDQVQILIRRVTLLDRRIDQLESRMPRAYWQRFVLRLRRLWARLVEKLT